MSNGLPQKGTQFDRGTNLSFPFTETMLDRKNADTALPTSSEVTPNDAGSALQRVYDETAIATLLAATHIAVAKPISMRLPDTLTGVTVGFNSSNGDGSNTQTGDGASAGSYATLTLSLHSSSQGSASILPDVSYTIKKAPVDNIWSTDYVFFMPGNFTKAQLLAKLTALAGATVLAAPLFVEQIDVLTLKGQSVTLSASADVQQHADISTTNVSKTTSSGDGTSIVFGVTTRTIQLPATIHGAITISGASSTAATSASATSTINSGTNWTALTATGSIGPISATGSVTPTTLSATPVTAIPTSGLYVISPTRVDPFSQFGQSMVIATVVDFSQFA